MATEDVTSKPILSPLALWYGVLAAPVAWIVRLIISYAMVEWLCRGDGAVVMHLTSVLFLVISLTGGWVAWRSYRTARHFEPTRVGPWRWERSYFMALVGLLNSVLFTVVILVEWSMVFFTDPCVVR
jgi:hypothetical protein